MRAHLSAVAILGGMLVAASGIAQAQATAPVTELRIIDVDAAPWDTTLSGPASRLKTKTLFRTENYGRVVFYYFLPTWDTKLHPAGSAENPARAHLHQYHEWSYILGGDYVIHEGISPFQRNPAVVRYVEGMWMSRPAYSLHSGDWATGGLRSQNPASMLVMEEGEHSVTYLPNSKQSSRSSKTRQAIVTDTTPAELARKTYTYAYIVNSGADMEWEDEPGTGRMVKWLSDDPEQGFRSQLIKVPPGWKPQADAAKTYFETANRVRYMLYGDLKIMSPSKAGAAPQLVTLKKDVLVHQPPGVVWAFADGSATDSGAVWLEVTYAKGLAKSTGPIEAIKIAR